MSIQRLAPPAVHRPAHAVTDRWFPCFRKLATPRARVFCFPFAGSGGSIFRSWHRQLPQDVEVRAVQLPGRGRRRDEALMERLDVVIDELDRAIQPLTDRPFVFFGHCFGAIICFELARALQRRNVTPPPMFVAGRQSPQLPPPAKLHQLSDEQLAGQLRSINAPLAHHHKDSSRFRQLLSAIRADARINETYCGVESARLASPITACHAMHDLAVSRQSLLGWHTQTTSEFRLLTIPGDHYWLLDEVLRLPCMHQLTYCLKAPPFLPKRSTRLRCSGAIPLREGCLSTNFVHD